MIPDIKDGVQTFADGRECCLNDTKGRREYRKRTIQMADRQNNRCCICGLYMPSTDITFDHEEGRGFSGFRRDDRIWKDGKPYNGAAHSVCNGTSGSKRTPYVI